MKNLVITILVTVLISSCSSEQKNRKMEGDGIIKSGIITKVSDNDFETTYDKLRSIVENNPNLKILMELDHQKNAASVGEELNPTRLILFGNPKLGTPLMKSAQTTSLDLPQKVIVYQDNNGEVKIAYNDPFYLEGRHHIEGQAEVLKKISGALDKITDGASQSE